MHDLPQKIVVWDMEWTCWKGSDERGFTGPGEHREIVQIGALLVETKSFKKLDSFQVFVKPKINPKLSSYFIKLTNITQKTIDRKGVNFPKALDSFRKWAKNYPLYSYTLTDRDVMMENCKLNNLILPFNFYRFFDVRMIFWKAGIKAEKYSSSSIVKAFNKKPKHRAHNALNDAKEIVNGLKELAISKRAPAS